MEWTNPFKSKKPKPLEEEPRIEPIPPGVINIGKVGANTRLLINDKIYVVHEINRDQVGYGSWEESILLRSLYGRNQFGSQIASVFRSVDV